VGGIPAAGSTVKEFKDQMVGSQFDAADKKTFVESIQHTVGASYSVNINEITQDWNYILEQYSSGKLTTTEFIEKESGVINRGNSIKN